MTGSGCTCIVGQCDTFTAGPWYLGGCSLTGTWRRTPWCFVKVIGSSIDFVNSTTVTLHISNCDWWNNELQISKNWKRHWMNVFLVFLLLLKYNIVLHCCLTFKKNVFQAEDFRSLLLALSDLKFCLSEENISFPNWI